MIYTYGPLGILSTRNFPTSYWLLQLFFDFYLVFQLFLGYQFLSKQSSVLYPLLYCLSIACYIWEPNFILQVANLLFLIQLSNTKNKNWLSFLIVCNISILTFIKLNTLIVSVFVLFALISILVRNKKYKNLVLSIFVLSGLHYYLIHIFNVSIINYILTSFDTIKFYSYAMYGHAKEYYSYMLVGGLFLIIAFLICALFFLKLIATKKTINLVCIVIIGVMFYVLFKQGFTRAAPSHFTQYFNFIPILFLMLLVIRFSKRLLWLQILSILFSYFVTISLILNKDAEYKDYNHFVYTVPILNYVSELIHFTTSSHTSLPANNSANAPTVDFLYNNCIAKNKLPQLKWNNRPAFQSIAAVSSKLDSINKSYYQSDKAPDFVYYSPEVVDDRNFLWNDPQVFNTLLKKYKLSNQQLDSQLIFEKKLVESKITTQLIIDTVIKLNTNFNLPDSMIGLYAIKVNVKENIWGKLMATLFQAPTLQVKTYFDDKNFEMYRYITPLHNNQLLIINKVIKPNNITDLAHFFNNLNSIEPNVKSFNFYTSFAKFFNTPIKLQLYKLRVE